MSDIAAENFRDCRILQDALDKTRQLYYKVVSV